MVDCIHPTKSRVIFWDLFSGMAQIEKAATLQAALSCSNPILIRIETKSGRRKGKLTEETADMWAFLVKELGMDGARGR